jgi:hypothetical protein
MMCYRKAMNHTDRIVSHALSCPVGLACVVMVLCICVVTQMLGIPATLMDLVNSDVLTKSEPVSEDFSALSSLTEPERPHFFRVVTEFRPVHHLPILATTVFHPPSA